MDKLVFIHLAFHLCSVTVERSPTPTTPPNPSSTVPSAPISTGPSNPGGLSSSDEIALGVGLGVGIPSLILAWLTYRVAIRGNDESRTEALRREIMGILTLGMRPSQHEAYSIPPEIPFGNERTSRNPFLENQWREEDSHPQNREIHGAPSSDRRYSTRNYSQAGVS